MGTGDKKPQSAWDSAQKQSTAGDPGLRSHSAPCTPPRAGTSVLQDWRSRFSSWNNDFKYKSFPQEVHKLTVQTPTLHCLPPPPETNGMILAPYLVSSQREGKVIFLQSDLQAPEASNPGPFKPGLLVSSLTHTHKLPIAYCKTRARGAPQPGTEDTGSGAAPGGLETLLSPIW